MPVSRSPIAYLERHGIMRTRRYPVSRMDTRNAAIRDAKVNNMAINPEVMLDATGSPPPDNGKTGPWPPPREVSDDEGLQQ